MALLLNGPIKDCARCSKTFQITSNRNIYCSRHCATEAKKIQCSTAENKWKKRNPDKIKLMGQNYYLCYKCNLGLGLFRHSINILYRASMYLKWSYAKELTKDGWKDKVLELIEE
jgi:hypothetical protein